MKDNKEEEAIKIRAALASVMTAIGTFSEKVTEPVRRHSCRFTQNPERQQVAEEKRARKNEKRRSDYYFCVGDNPCLSHEQKDQTLGMAE